MTTTSSIQNKKVRNAKPQRENVTDFFSTMDFTNDYPVLPGKKDFMHVRGFLFNDIKKIFS